MEDEIKINKEEYVKQFMASAKKDGGVAEIYVEKMGIEDIISKKPLMPLICVSCHDKITAGALAYSMELAVNKLREKQGVREIVDILKTATHSAGEIDLGGHKDE